MTGQPRQPYVAGAQTALDSAITCMTEAIRRDEIDPVLSVLAESVRLELIRQESIVRNRLTISEET